MQVVLVTHMLETNDAYITDVQLPCKNANGLIEQNFQFREVSF